MHLSELVRLRREHHDSCAVLSSTSSLVKLFREQRREQEVSQVVDRPLGLVSLLRLPKRRGHFSSVADEVMQRAFLFEELGRKGAHGVQVSEIKLSHFDCSNVDVVCANPFRVMNNLDG